MGQNQSDSIIDSLNKQQEEYYIKRKLHHLSKSPCFKGFKRLQGNDDQKSTKKVPHDRTKCFFIKLLPYDTEKEVRYYDREQKILDLFIEEEQILQNGKIVNVTIKEKNCILVPSKYYHLHDFFEYISNIWNKFPEPDEKLIRSVSFQALKILKILKTHKVVHNGIKLENFILASDAPVKIILTDFKLAQILNQNEKSNVFNGTPVYKAPEVLRKQGHSYEADMWSLAANVYLSFFKKFPFEIEQNDTEEEILGKINSNPLSNKGRLLNDDAWEFMTKALALDPADRITPEDSINLKWFDPELNPPNVAPSPSEIRINDGHESSESSESDDSDDSEDDDQRKEKKSDEGIDADQFSDSENSNESDSDS